MALTTTNAQISIQDGAGAVTNLSNNATGSYTPGGVATFALQSTSGVQRWTLLFNCPAYPSLHQAKLEVIPGQQANIIQVAMPAYPSLAANQILNTIQVTSVVSDGVSSIAQALYTLQAVGGAGQSMTRYADLTMNAALAAYTNVAGVITANANGAMANVDGTAVTVGMKILINGLAATAADAGLWQVTSVGGASAPFVLTRDPSWPQGGILPAGTICEVNQGTAWANSRWKITSTGNVTVGTTDPKLLPGCQKGTGATGGGTTVSITTLFAAGAAPASILVANDATGAAAVQVGAIVGSTAGAGTCTLTGTTAHTINWALFNF